MDHYSRGVSEPRIGKQPCRLNLRANEVQCQLMILNISREALDLSFILVDSKRSAHR
jgi:hypothetical protein